LTVTRSGGRPRQRRGVRIAPARKQAVRRIQVKAAAADTAPMLLALAFQPIFIYIALGLVGLIAVARLVLGWAMNSS